DRPDTPAAGRRARRSPRSSRRCALPTARLLHAASSNLEQFDDGAADRALDAAEEVIRAGEDRSAYVPHREQPLQRFATAALSTIADDDADGPSERPDEAPVEERERRRDGDDARDARQTMRRHRGHPRAEGVADEHDRRAGRHARRERLLGGANVALLLA